MFTTAVYAFVNIGGSASKKTAIQVGQKPSPSPNRSVIGRATAMIANDGIARPIFTMLTATMPPRLYVPEQHAGWDRDHHAHK